MAVLTLRINTQNMAITQYNNFDFNSFAMRNGKTLALGSDGVYELGGNTDNGTAISSRVDLPTSDYGTAYNKRIRKIYFGGMFGGNLSMTVTDDENKTTAYTLTPLVLNKHMTAKVNGQRYGNKGCYYSVSISNTSGCYFDIDFIKIIPVIINRLPVSL